jgi:hypothetical protein
MLRKLRPLVAFLAMSAGSVAGATTIDDHINWCLRHADQNMTQQPWDRVWCNKARALNYWFMSATGSPINLDTTRQPEWGRASLKFACMGGDIADQAAIRLMQACHCHNDYVAEWIENNQDQTREAMRDIAGCPR